MLDAQRSLVVGMTEAIAAQVDREPSDAVLLWRSESSNAALRFLDRVQPVKGWRAQPDPEDRLISRGS